jgi:multidrug efflux pump subunit AcrB
MNALRSRNKNVPAGNLKTQSNKKLVRLEGSVKSSDELSNVFVRTNFTGKNVKLSDVAKVFDGKEDIKVRTRVNGQEATLLIVTKKGGTDTIKLVKEVQKKLKEFQAKMPQDFKFVIYNNEGLKVENRMNVLASNAFTGLICVFVFLLIFLPGKIGIVASLSLPIAVLATMGLMPYMGMNINAITVLALVIAIGMLVDNSVVISENFTRLKEDEGLNSYDAAVKSAMQFWLPITATVLTTIAAFMPMLVTKGIMGQFIKYIPWIVSISLFFSLFECFFFLPMRLKMMYSDNEQKDEKKEKKKDFFEKISEPFQKFTLYLVKRRYMAMIIYFSIVIFSIVLLKANKFILFPAEQTEIYTSRFILSADSTLESTYKVSQDLSIKVKNILKDNISNIVARAGISQVGPIDPRAIDGDHVGMLNIYMTKKASLEMHHTDVLKQLRTIKIPQVKELSFQAVINGPPVGEAVNATFRSNDMKQLQTLVSSIKKDLSSKEGIVNVGTDKVLGEDEVFVELDYPKVARLGINVNAIGDTIKTALKGNESIELNLKNKKFKIKVQFKKDYIENIDQLKNITIIDRLGNLIPLGSIAKFTKSTGSPVIKRFDFQRSRTLTADILEDKTDSPTANNALLNLYNNISKKLTDVSIAFGGQAQNTKESMESLRDAGMLALIAIFAIMVFVFNSFLRPFIIMTTIPLGLFGFSTSFFLHQRPISFLALIGIIGLTGIIVNSGIVLISFIEQLKKDSKESLDIILAKASKMRLRAVLVTSLTTVSGLLPTAYGIGGRDIILIPMTMSMAWGLVSGTLLTIIWIPCAYAIQEDIVHFFKSIFKKIIKV